MKKLIVKELANQFGVFQVVSIGFIALLLIVVTIQFFKIGSLEKTVQTKVYVAVDNKMYEARPEIKTKKDKLDYEVFGTTWAYNMFGHDINSLDERLSIAEPLIYAKGYQYILSNYTTGKNAGWQEGLKNIKELYKNRDARSYYVVDSVKVNMDEKTKIVDVYGKQKAVFAVGDDVLAPMSFRLDIVDCDKSNENPYGLYIKKFNYIK
ncbi:MAG: hypothetical protein N4A74_25550 [Carboxylicivirga sp.]|jgi:hypothetical protein|nr:hypothetical protein [Carboxylicivirga sp.]